MNIFTESHSESEFSATENPLAYYRRHATFVDIDGARGQIEIADARKSALKSSNTEFIHTDFLATVHRLSSEFNYIIAHGGFSCLPHDVRDALLEICAQCLHRVGLQYLNYDTSPGWNVRGVVREFLLAQNFGRTSLRIRAQLANCDVASQ